jgi:hypothetical protein
MVFLRHKAGLPSQVAGRWGMGIIKCAMRKIIFCTGLTRAAAAGRKSIVPARRANEPTTNPRFFQLCIAREIQNLQLEMKNLDLYICETASLFSIQKRRLKHYIFLLHRNIKVKQYINIQLCSNRLLFKMRRLKGGWGLEREVAIGGKKCELEGGRAELGKVKLKRTEQKLVMR